jgi:hypothetical protein
MLILQTTPISFLQQGQVTHCHFQLRLYHLTCNRCTRFTASFTLLFLDQVELTPSLPSSRASTLLLLVVDPFSTHRRG